MWHNCNRIIKYNNISTLSDKRKAVDYVIYNATSYTREGRWALKYSIICFLIKYPFLLPVSKRYRWILMLFSIMMVKAHRAFLGYWLPRLFSAENFIKNYRTYEPKKIISISRTFIALYWKKLFFSIWTYSSRLEWPFNSLIWTCQSLTQLEFWY